MPGTLKGMHGVENLQQRNAIVTTGLSYGRPDRVGHVERAVKNALKKANVEQANSVLLFLTSDYAQNPTPACALQPVLPVAPKSPVPPEWAY